MKRYLIFAAAIAVVFAACPVDAAPTVDVDYTGVSPTATVSIASVHHTGGVLAGVYNLTLSNLTGPGAPALQMGPVRSFCIDIVDNSTGATVPYDIMDLAQTPDSPGGPMLGQKAQDVARLLSSYSVGVATLTNNEAAAIQVAIWEIVNEKTDSFYSLSSGGFTATGTPVARASYMLANLGTVTSKFVGLSNTSWQDYVVEVPVPGAVLLGLLGMSVAGLKLRKHA